MEYSVEILQLSVFCLKLEGKAMRNTLSMFHLSLCNPPRGGGELAGLVLTKSA